MSLKGIKWKDTSKHWSKQPNAKKIIEKRLNTLKKKGFPKPWLGKHRPDVMRKVNEGRDRWTKDNPEKLKEKYGEMKGHWIGDKNPNWAEGKSKERYGEDWTDELRESIRMRDKYICQLCGIHQDEIERKLQVHHIDYNKYNLNPNNLISLCTSCHMKTNFNRESWIHYFNKLTYL